MSVTHHKYSVWNGLDRSGASCLYPIIEFTTGPVRGVGGRCPLQIKYYAITFLGTLVLWQHRTIPALRLKHRSDGCGTASALPKCSIMSGCGTRIVLRGQKPLALCDRCPCFGSLLPPLAALTFAASSIICAFGLASAAPRSPYRHLELCGIALFFIYAYHTHSPLNTYLSSRSKASCTRVRGSARFMRMAQGPWNIRPSCQATPTFQPAFSTSAMVFP